MRWQEPESNKGINERQRDTAASIKGKNMDDRKINVVFDVDDTMYDLMEPFKKAHESLFAERVHADVTELFFHSRIYSDILLELEKSGKLKKEDAFYERLRMTYRDAGLEIKREEAQRFETEYRYNQTQIELFDFMEPVLNYCKAKGIPIALLTNGSGEGQLRKVDALKLRRWFLDERIFISGEIGYQKPDVRVFKAVEERTGFFPEHTWYIGDTYESDIVGAARAGWHSIWLNHRKRVCPAEINEAEEELKSGGELLKLLKGINHNKSAGCR